jgi:type I restriction enzyme M protein
MIDRVHLELTGEDIQRIAQPYHIWRGDPLGSPHAAIQDYQDVPGFCKSATLADIRGYGHVLTPGRYVGAEEAEDDGQPFEEKMAGLVAELNVQFVESAKLESRIKNNWANIGYAGTPMARS